MPRFRKRPVEIEARRVPDFDEYESAVEYVNTIVALGQWFNGKTYLMTPEGEYAHDGAKVIGPHVVVPTLEGDMIGLPGDWIIQGVNGEFYPCKPDIFEKTYEPVDAYLDHEPLTAPRDVLDMS